MYVFGLLCETYSLVVAVVGFQFSLILLWNKLKKLFHFNVLNISLFIFQSIKSCTQIYKTYSYVKCVTFTAFSYGTNCFRLGKDEDD